MCGYVPWLFCLKLVFPGRDAEGSFSSKTLHTSLFRVVVISSGSRRTAGTSRSLVLIGMWNESTRGGEMEQKREKCKCFSSGILMFSVNLIDCYSSSMLQPESLKGDWNLTLHVWMDQLLPQFGEYRDSDPCRRSNYSFLHLIWWKNDLSNQPRQ